MFFKSKGMVRWDQGGGDAFIKEKALAGLNPSPQGEGKGVR